MRAMGGRPGASSMWEDPCRFAPRGPQEASGAERRPAARGFRDVRDTLHRYDSKQVRICYQLLRNWHRPLPNIG